MRRGWGIGVASLVTFLACVDTSDLAGGSPEAPCPVGQQRLDGRCVEAPAPEPVQPDGTCKPGLQDNDKDGTCEASCTGAKLDCGAHGRCDDAKGKASCVCAVGYAREADACVWRGGIVDPGFQNTPQAWITAGAAAIDPTAKSAVDPGVARFAAPSACDGSSLVKQTFPMPSFAEADPFALDIDAAQIGPGGGGNSPTLSIALGGGFVVDQRPATTGRLHQCLGERAYGRDVEIVLRRVAGACPAGSSLDVDRASIVVEPACPPPGKVVNGDFEGNGGWTPSGTGAEVATGVGTGGGRGGHVFTTNNCQGPSLTGFMSAPFSSVTRGALTLSFKGTNGQRMLVSAGTFPIGEVLGNATFQSAALCVPEWAKGSVQPIRFSLPDPGGLCADPNVRDFVFDDASFASQATCPEAATIVNGGFEDPVVPSTPWRLAQSTPFTTNASIVKSANAHSGAAYLRLSVAQVCASASAKQVVTVPPADAQGGPALKLWYRLPTTNRASFAVVVGPNVAAALPASAAWIETAVCLPPHEAGLPRDLALTASGGAGTCADTFTSEGIEIDDLRVTTDPSCPR